MERTQYKKPFIQVIINQLAVGKYTPNIKATSLPYVFDHMVEVYKDGGKAKRHNIFTNKRI
jgi:hypothetical protein